MKTIEISEIAVLIPLLQAERPEPLFVTHDGQTVAAIVPATEGDAENLLLSINPQFQAVLERSQQRLESEGTVTSAEVRHRLGLPAAGTLD